MDTKQLKTIKANLDAAITAQARLYERLEQLAETLDAARVALAEFNSVHLVDLLDNDTIDAAEYSAMVSAETALERVLAELGIPPQMPPKHAATPLFHIMPRNPKATGLQFQAGIYAAPGNYHDLIAECYSIERATELAAILNAHINSGNAVFGWAQKPRE